MDIGGRTARPVRELKATIAHLEGLPILVSPPYAISIATLLSLAIDHDYDGYCDKSDWGICGRAVTSII